MRCWAGERDFLEISCDGHDIFRVAFAWPGIWTISAWAFDASAF